MSGLSFKKLDLHIHTPASEDFYADASPEDIISEAKRKGLDGIAITDHNTAEWVDKVKEAAKNTGITVFPGVEISCVGGESGIHVVALFDPSVNMEHIKGFLSSLAIPPSNQGKPNALASEKTIQQLIDQIQSPIWGGLAVLAHANSSKGVLHDMKGEQRTLIIKHPALMAVEGTDFQDREKQEKHRRVVDLLDGTDSTYQRKLAVYQASDNPDSGGQGHSIEGIGTRCAYFKMEKVNLESLRQCFCDPDVRIRQDFEYQERSYPYITRIKVTGGFLDGEEVNFHTGLNSILGAKGTGKSLLIELLRFGLGQPPVHSEIARDHNSKLELRLREFSYVEIWFTDENGKENYIRRVYNPTIGSPFDVDFEPSQLFPVLFLSQNEIIKIAENEGEQLSFIDMFFNFQGYKINISQLEKELEKLDRRMAEGLRAYSEYESLETQISTVKAEIVRLDESLKHPIFQRYSHARQKNQALTEQSRYLQSLRMSFENLQGRTVREDSLALPPELSHDPALRRNLATIQATQVDIEKSLRDLQQSVASSQAKIDDEIDKWQSDFDHVKNEYDQLVQEKGGDYQALAAQREQNVKRLDELNRQLLIIQRRKDSTEEIAKQRNELLDELENVYTEYTRQRQERCDKFQLDSGGKLQLRILGSSNSDEFKRRLLELKQGSYLKEYEIDAICAKLKPREFIIALLRFNAAQASKLRDTQKHLKDVAQRADIPLQRMIRLAEFLTEAIEPSHLLALQYKAYPQDRPEIKFDIGEGKYEPLDSISTGQKSTALLLMALSAGKMPIVIDQPEDSLDIRSIWNDICSKLRDGKDHRQFIFTTHNASVAVASDTDYFIIMDGNSNRGRVVYKGSMDHAPVADEVLTYLEGGVPTYRRKYLKYRAEDRLRD